MSPRIEISVENLKTELQRAANSTKVPLYQKYFKTEPGEYAEGDVFIGVTVPQQRILAKRYKSLSFSEVEQLLRSKIHEERFTGLIILKEQFKKTKTKKKHLIELYLKNKQHVNNWDLVDSSAIMLGEYLFELQDFSMLKNLLQSKSIWDRRIAVISTFYFIKMKRPELSLRFAQQLFTDKEPLLHKAVGWMLREVGKSCGQKFLTDFLEENVTQMPTIMFSYATERLPIPKKAYYQKLRRNFRKNNTITH